MRVVALLCLAAIGAGCAGGGVGAAGGAAAGGMAGPGGTVGPGGVAKAGGPVQPGSHPAAAATPFDYDWSVRRIGGGEVSLEALRGRTLVVNFWASWCPPCIRELGSFQALMASVRARGIDATFLFVSPESLEVASEFVEDNGWELPFAVELRRAPATLGELVLPTTFIVDRRGAIALRHRGATDWNQPEVIELLASLDGPEEPRPGSGGGSGSGGGPAHGSRGGVPW